MHAHSSGRSLPPWGSPFWELRAARGVGGSGVRAARRPCRRPGSRAGPFRERGCALPGAMLLLGILMLLLAGAPAGGSEPEREVVVPIRLDPDINGRHYYWQGPEDSRDQGLIFQITAFQEDFYLHLTPDAQFLAPAFATEHLGVPLQGLIRSSPDLRRCFYSGDVNAEPDSFAALSLCGGLRGAFGYRGAEYVISPLPNTSAPAAQRNSQGAHLLQRRGVPGGPPGDPTSRCGVGSGWNPAILRALDPYTPRRIGLGEARSRRRSGRAKRFVSIPRYVETLVVADESMVKFHGADLEHYLLTLLATAARLYRHPSILNPINIVVVKVLLLGDRDTGPKVTGNAALTLRNFCAWQKKLNKVSDKHPEYWDTAILFTRQVSRSVISLDPGSLHLFGWRESPPLTLPMSFMPRSHRLTPEFEFR